MARGKVILVALVVIGIVVGAIVLLPMLIPTTQLSGGYYYNGAYVASARRADNYQFINEGGGSPVDTIGCGVVVTISLGNIDESSITSHLVWRLQFVDASGQNTTIEYQSALISGKAKYTYTWSWSIDSIVNTESSPKNAAGGWTIRFDLLVTARGTSGGNAGTAYTAPPFSGALAWDIAYNDPAGGFSIAVTLSKA